MNKTNDSKIYCLLIAILLAVTTVVSAQSPCVTVKISAIRDTFLIETNRDSIVVRIDKTIAEQSIDVVCVDIASEGYYRINAGVEYSGGTSNESFFLKVINDNSNSSGMCDANAGTHKVVKVVEDIPDVETDMVRDAGVFFFKHGQNTISLNHYALIADQFPQFLDTSSGGFNGPESVHLFQIVLEYITESTYDLELDQVVSTDSLYAGDSLLYNLNIFNHGPGTAYDISLTDELPTLLKLDSTGFKIAPDSIAFTGKKQKLYWSFDSLAVDSAIKIRLTAAALGLEKSSNTQFKELRNLSKLVSVCDINKVNNKDSSSVILVIPPLLTDIAISQKVQTDSFTVLADDTTWFADAGETFQYHITVHNERDTEAKNVIFFDVLPDSVAVDSNVSGDTIKVLLGSLLPFADTTLTLDVHLASIMPEGENLLINYVLVTADNEDPNARQNNASVDTVFNKVRPNSTDVSLTQFVKTDSFTVSGSDTQWYAVAGEKFSYHITVRNEGEADAKNIVIFEVLPDSVSLAAANMTDTLQLNVGTLLPFADTTFTLDVRLASVMPVGENLLINHTLVEAENEPAELLFNNVAVDTVINIIEPILDLLTDLTIFQSVIADSFEVSGGDTLWIAKAGETISYFLTVVNLENVEAINVLVLDVIPDSTRANGMIAGDTLFWQLGNLAPLARATVSFKATISQQIKPGTTLTLINRAMVKAANENPEKLANNYSVVTESVLAIPEEIFNEDCDLLTLDFNVYRPDNGQPLTINFELNTAKIGHLDVYDMTGYHIRELANHPFKAGRNRLQWNGKTANGLDAGSGVYIVVLRAGSYNCWKKVIVVR